MTRFIRRKSLGEGGQAEVFEAYDTVLERSVALKVYSGEVDLDALTIEFRTVCDLHHPNLAQMFDLVIDEGRGELAMELFDHALRVEDFRIEGQPNPDALERLEHALLSGLAALHKTGVVHGDVKPNNILVRGDRIALSDFGLARHTDDQRRGPLAGTPRYLAPEVFLGHQPSPQSDLYAVGVVLLECASGEAPVLPPAPTAQLRLTHPWLLDRTKWATAFPRSGERLRRFLSTNPADRGDLDNWTQTTAVLPLIGRDEELKLFHALENKARTLRRPVRIDVVADSGLGKSRLLQEAKIRSHAPAVYIPCHPHESLPFAVVDALLEQLARQHNDDGTLGRQAEQLRKALFKASAQSDTDPEAVIGRIVALLDAWASKQTLTIFIDDAHLGDEDSGRIVAAMLETSRSPILLALAHRPSEADSDSLLSALANVPIDTQVHLRPLADTEVLQLVEARGDMRNVPPERIVARCNGHPFLATFLRDEDLNTDTEGAPTFEERLRAIHPRALDVCLTMRAAGGPVTRRLLRLAASGVDVDPAFDALLDERILRRAGHGGEVELSHQRLIETIWQQLGPLRRERYHAAVAHGLVKTGGSPDQIAMQAYLGGQIDVAAARAAADRAFALRAFRRAATFEAICLEAARQQGQDDAIIAHHHRRADALALTGDGRAAAEHLLEVIRGTDRHEAIVRTKLRAAEHLLSAGDVQRAAELIQAVADRLSLPFPRTVTARLAAMAWERLRLRGLDPDTLHGHDAAAPDIADSLILEVEYTWRLAFHFGIFEAHPGAQARLLKLAALTRRPDDLVRASALELAYSALYGFQSEWVSKIEAVLRRTQPHAAPLAVGFSVFAQGFGDLCAGRYPSAESQFRRVLEIAATERVAPWFADMARLYGFAAAGLQGRFDEAIALGFEARQTWVAEKKPGLVAQFDTFIGFHRDLKDARPSRALLRLRRARLGPGSSNNEYLRVLAVAGVFYAARHPRAARRTLRRHLFTLLGKSTEIYGRTVIAWVTFMTVADVPQPSLLRRWCLRRIAQWCAASPHPAGAAMADAMYGLLALRSNRIDIGLTRLRRGRDGLLDQRMRAHAGAVDELLAAAGDTTANAVDYLGASTPDVWRRWFRLPWPEKGL